MSKGTTNLIVKWLVVGAAIITIFASCGTAFNNVKGWIGNKSDSTDSTTTTTSTESAYVQVVDLAE